MKRIKTFEEFVDNTALNETVKDVNGDIISIVDENNQQSEYTDIETAFDIINKEIDRIYDNEV